MTPESARLDWSKEVPKSLIGAIATALVAFVGTNIGFFWWAPETLRDIVDRQQEIVEPVTDQLKTRTQYQDLVNAALKNSVGRNNERSRWTNADQFTKNAGEIHRTSVAAREAVNEELGALRAYSPSSTGLSPELHHADLQFLTDELAVWESLDSLVEAATAHGPSSPDYRAAFDAWMKSLLDYQGAMANVEESARLEFKRIPTEERELARKEQAMHAAFHDYRKQLNLAIVVVDVPFGATFGLLGYLLLRRWPRPVPDPIQSPAKRKLRRR